MQVSNAVYFCKVNKSETEFTPLNDETSRLWALSAPSKDHAVSEFNRQFEKSSIRATAADLHVAPALESA